MFDWNDLRHFLAVARTGSTLAAARAIGVNQSTAARRIAALEETLGATLFERHAKGYRLSEAGRALLPAAERVEAAVRAFTDANEARQRRVTTVLRLTASETMANRMLVPVLGAFRTLQPAIRIEILIDDRPADLARGEADIALRAGARPQDDALFGRRLLNTAWTAYCSESYAAANGTPQSPADLRRFALIGGEGRLAALPQIGWLHRTAGEDAIGFRSNSLISLLTAVRAGFGVTMLPCLVGDAEPDLVRCFPPDRTLDAELWLLAPERLRDSPAVRAVFDFLPQRIQLARALCEGEMPRRREPLLV
jgi:DNA-binding transcriptional LysR family regulator